MINTTLIIPTLILTLGLITDIKARKIYNWLVGICLLLAILHVFYFYDFATGIKQGLLGGGLALIITLPMVLVGVLGAGDMKLLFTFGFATSYTTALNVIIYSFIWATLIGLIYVIVGGRLVSLFHNMLGLALGQKPDKAQLNHIPFTVALMLAWLSHLASQHWGFSL